MDNLFLTLDNLFLILVLIGIWCGAFLIAGLFQWVATRRFSRQSWRHKGKPTPLTMRDHTRSLDK